MRLTPGVEGGSLEVVLEEQGGSLREELYTWLSQLCRVPDTRGVRPVLRGRLEKGLSVEGGEKSGGAAEPSLGRRKGRWYGDSELVRF